MPNHRNHLDDTDDDDLGVFTFAKKTAALALPMGIVAGVFGVWMDSRLDRRVGEMKEAIAGAINAHVDAESKLYVTKTEFALLKQILDERYIQEVKNNEEQSRYIQRNTIFLERISQKLGIQRPPE